ncbi:hypothetical protein GOODEAATRI_001810 [Goodea atripinnis]|uniref:Uncharacterized protein n=1 Tax=Goodea atripinnis TaxID=208336 RepID=A0ABV0MXX7_9TELE
MYSLIGSYDCWSDEKRPFAGRRSSGCSHGAAQCDSEYSLGLTCVSRQTRTPPRNPVQRANPWRKAKLLGMAGTSLSRFSHSLCFQFLLPVIQISLICLCVGGDPKGIKVAVVNNDTNPLSSSFSVSLLSFLDNSSVIQV